MLFKIRSYCSQGQEMTIAWSASTSGLLFRSNFGENVQKEFGRCELRSASWQWNNNTLKCWNGSLSFTAQKIHGTICQVTCLINFKLNYLQISSIFFSTSSSFLKNVFLKYRNPWSSSFILFFKNSFLFIFCFFLFSKIII